VDKLNGMDTEDMLKESLEAGRLLVNNQLQSLLDESLTNGHNEVVELAGSVLMAGGKRLRPVLSILAYQLAGGMDEDKVLPMALAFELIHTATLVHDDINDSAKQRRGVATIHEKSGVAKAIIAGDWLFVQGFGLGGSYDSRIVSIMTECCADIASSEIKQLNHVNNLATTPEDYYSIIRGKTAGPFAAGCEAAAYIAGASEEEAVALRRFGMELGVTFQLVDDLLDILGDERMGKPRGADVVEGKMTLPLIHALTLLHGSSRERLAEIIANFSDNLWSELIDLLNEAGSIEYVRTLTQTHLERGLQELQIFPKSDLRTIIESLAKSVIDRHI